MQGVTFMVIIGLQRWFRAFISEEGWRAIAEPRPIRCPATFGGGGPTRMVVSFRIVVYPAV